MAPSGMTPFSFNNATISKKNLESEYLLPTILVQELRSIGIIKEKIKQRKVS